MPELIGLEDMLTRGESLHQDGKVYQAMDIYFRLVEDYPDTDTAQRAREQLVALAREFEGEGKPRMAASIRERLARQVSIAPSKPGLSYRSVWL